MRALRFAVIGSALVASVATAVPAAAAPPGPVTDVRVTSGIVGDSDVTATVSWAQQDPNAEGARACATQGVHASQDPNTCDVIADTDTTSAQLTLLPWRTYSFSVFAFVGADAQQREFSSPVTTPAFHGSTLVMRNKCGVPTYGEPCRYETLLTDTHSGKRIAGQVVTLFAGEATTHPAWRTYNADRTDANGLAHVPVTLRQPRTLQWRYSGTEGVLASASDRDTVKPEFRVTAHLTSSTASPGQKVKLFGVVHPTVDHVRAYLNVEARCGFVQDGTTQAVKQRRLPNGKTAFGYVFTVSRTASGTTTFVVSLGSSPEIAGGLSPEVSLTVGQARGAARDVPTKTRC